MAHGGGVAPILRLKRSLQSGVKTMTAAYVAVYTNSSSYAYLFAGAEIDLTNMIAGDVIDVRVRKRIVSGGAFIPHDTKTYTGAQPTVRKAVKINPIIDVYGVEIGMRQTAGVLRNITIEISDALR